MSRRRSLVSRVVAPQRGRNSSAAKRIMDTPSVGIVARLKVWTSCQMSLGAPSCAEEWRREPRRTTWAQRLALSPGPQLQAPCRGRPIHAFAARLVVATHVWHAATPGSDAAAVAHEAYRRLLVASGSPLSQGGELRLCGDGGGDSVVDLTGPRACRTRSRLHRVMTRWGRRCRWEGPVHHCAMGVARAEQRIGSDVAARGHDQPLSLYRCVVEVREGGASGGCCICSERLALSPVGRGQLVQDAVRIRSVSVCGRRG